MQGYLKMNRYRGKEKQLKKEKKKERKKEDKDCDEADKWIEDVISIIKLMINLMLIES